MGRFAVPQDSANTLGIWKGSLVMCYPHSSSFPNPSPEMRAILARVYLKSCLDIL